MEQPNSFHEVFAGTNALEAKPTPCQERALQCSQQSKQAEDKYQDKRHCRSLCEPMKPDDNVGGFQDESRTSRPGVSLFTAAAPIARKGQPPTRLLDLKKCQVFLCTKCLT